MNAVRPPVLTVRDAILAAVKAVPSVVAACGLRIGDTVPTKGPLSQPPHVTIGPAAWTRGENGADPLGMLRLRIFVASDQPARDQAWMLAQAIAEALEGKVPEIGGGFHLIDCIRVVNIGDVIDKIAPTEVFLDVTTIAQRNP